MSDQHADPPAAIASMYNRGEAVKREAVETATTKLATDEDLDPETEAAVESLADRLVEGLLAPPAATLATAEDEATVETALELFGSERDPTADRDTESETDRAAARVGD